MEPAGRDSGRQTSPASWLSVPGIDAVLIGPADLSISLGVPGGFQHASMVEAIEAIRNACQRHGVAPGIHMRSLAHAKFWIEHGMQFVSCGNEVSFLHERASEVAVQLRSSAGAVSYEELGRAP